MCELSVTPPPMLCQHHNREQQHGQHHDGRLGVVVVMDDRHCLSVPRAGHPPAVPKKQMSHVNNAFFIVQTLIFEHRICAYRCCNAPFFVRWIQVIPAGSTTTNPVFARDSRQILTTCRRLAWFRIFDVTVVISACPPMPGAFFAYFL